MRLELKGGKIDNIEHAMCTAMKEFYKSNPELLDLFKKQDEIYADKITIDFKFIPSKGEEPQVVTTDNHEGIPELLVVEAQFDDNGELVSSKDNDGDSLFTNTEAMIASGIPENFTEVESEYTSDMLELVDSYTSQDMGIDLYKIISGEYAGQYLTQYYSDGSLVGEFVTDQEDAEKVFKDQHEGLE